MLDHFFELDYYDSSHCSIIGVDEVGRGPLAGPVFAAAFQVSAKSFNELQRQLTILKQSGLTDSKKLTAGKRQKILQSFDMDLPCDDILMGLTQNLSWYKKFSIGTIALGCSTPEEIDQMNILQSSLLAMERSVECLQFENSIILVDGKFTMPKLMGMTKQFPVIQGDIKSLLIGLAAIFAKQSRDRLMELYDELYPQYGFAGHRGYPVKKHLEAIKNYGASPIHRQSFKGVHP